MMAVVPSGASAFGLVPFCASNRRTVARSPFSAASRSVGSAVVATETAASQTIKPTIGTAVITRILDLREKTAAVANRFHRDIVAVKQRHQQIGKARILWILQMLAALDASVRMAEQRGRQRIVVVRIAVAHVAAIKNGRVIQHGAIAFLRCFDLLDESR